MADARLAGALDHHRQGRLDDAAVLYDRLIAENPANADAWHLRGVVALQQGDARRALVLIGQALAAREDVADFHSNIGEAWRALGDLDRALGHYRRALALDAGHLDAHNNAGVALKAKGALEAAEAHFRRVLAAEPDHSRALNNLGALLRARGLPAEAEQCLRRAVAVAPSYADAHTNLGNALWALGREDEALDHYRRAIALEPANAGALINLGTALEQQGDLESSSACYRRALAASPDNADAHFNLANNLAAEGLGEDARAAYLRAIAADAGHVGAQVNLARLDLLDGRFAAGFDRWEWRWREPDCWRRILDSPVWDGAPLAGRTLAVWGEQGVGDEIMLGSVLPDAIATAGHVVVECDPRLVPLFARACPAAEFVARDSPPAPRLAAADIDLQCALGSLCRWLRRRPEDFAAPKPTLIADPAKVEAARARSGAPGPGLKVGIAWRSVPRGAEAKTRRFSRAKSIPLDDWAPILTTPGVRFVDLQYGDTADELRRIEDRLGVRIHHDEAVDQMASLEDFAAQIAALDMVVAASNTTVHLAGALGLRVWTMVPFVPDWRWQRGREDTLWYPHMRLFRQPAPGAWAPVIARVAEELGRLAEGAA